ncbi:branched-chain amino acid ABC transporter permease [Corynebacterium sp. BCW_4722]|nr:branched-chain amino acid ABC transporter permease [Corynebacterium sp. BCW_4722]
MAVSRETSQGVRLGLRDSWVVAVGLVPLGLAFGLLMTQAGFAWWWTPIVSTVILAGSMEFLTIEMMLTGVGPIASAVTAFMVNFRHIFYGLTFPRHVVRGVVPKVYSTYALTDEAYAVASTIKGPVTGARVLTIEGFIQLSWVLSGIVGALVGQIIPPELEGMDFALVALFAVLAYDAFRAIPDFSGPLLAGGIAIVAAVLFPAQMVIVALVAYFGIIVARFWAPKLDDALTWKAK